MVVSSHSLIEAEIEHQRHSRGVAVRRFVCDHPDLVGLGLAIGLGAAFYLSESVKMFQFDVSPHDLTTFAIVPCVLVAVALLACYVPARRALSVDPLRSLKAE